MIKCGATLPSSSFYYFKKEYILRIHKILIDAKGGSDAILNEERLESSIECVKQTFDGKPLFDNHISIANAYNFYFSKNHPFVDGNKRIGAFLALEYLKLYGIVNDIDEHKFEMYCWAIARGCFDREQAEICLKRLIVNYSIDVHR